MRRRHSPRSACRAIGAPAARNWLLAQQALEYDERGWEKDAWYHDRQGDEAPVVAALKAVMQAERVSFGERLRGAEAQAAFAAFLRK